MTVYPNSFYCIILLSAMFMASCYWPPVPLDSPLSSPWSDNITTFGEALLSRIPNLPTDMIPSTIPIIDRCWCDFSGGLFEPFNTTRWEANSVEKLARELELKLVESSREGMEETEMGDKTDAEIVVFATTSQEVPSPTPSVSPTSLGFFGGLWPFSRSSPHPGRVPAAASARSTNGTARPEERKPHEQQVKLFRPHPPPFSQRVFSVLQKEYDLRPYGFDVVVDLGWAR